MPFIDRAEEEGREIIENKIKDRSNNPGGNGVELIGGQGSGKTSAFFNLATDFAKTDSIMFWREPTDSPIQFIKYPDYDIFVERGMDIDILNKSNGGKKLDYYCKRFDELPIIDYKVETDTDPEIDDIRENEEKKEMQDRIFQSIFNRANPNKLNVIFFKRPYSWVDLIRYSKEVPRWIDIFIDEHEDIFPANSRGRTWHRISWARDNIKQVRKGRVNLLCNTQNKNDVDYRIRQKMTIWGYMTGGIPDPSSPIKKNAVRGLKRGEIFFDWMRTKFGKVNTPPWKEQEDMFVAKRKIKRIEA